MKLLYYSTAYFSSHGGSSHSQAFIREAGKHKLVDDLIIFPEKTQARNSNTTSPLRKLIRRNPLMQLFLFYRRNTFYLAELEKILLTRKPDAVLIRLDSNFRQIKFIRRKFPSIVVSAEINASPFDEAFENIAIKGLMKRQERKYLSFSHCNFFVSGKLRESILGKLIDPARDFIVHNGVDIDTFKVRMDKQDAKTKIGIPTEKFVFGYIGTIDTHKRVEALIGVFAEFHKKIDSAFLVIVGDGPQLNELKSTTAALGLKKAVLFTGWIAHADVPQHLNAFDVAVHHHANNYMSPLKIFEYLAMGLPVIAPDVDSVREILRNEEHVLYTNGSREDLFEKMLRLYNDKELRGHIAEVGKKHVSEKFPWSVNADFIISKMKERTNT